MKKRKKTLKARVKTEKLKNERNTGKDSRKQIELLKNIVASIAGTGATGMVDLLYGKKNINEFLIAKKLKLTINQTRNILYKLADEGLVSFVRKKDSRKGGWYTYYWTLDAGKSLSNLKDALLKEIENLQSQLNSKKTKRFYYSPACSLELTEENALLHDFTCPECGDVLALKDNASEVQKLEKETAKFKSNLEFVSQELEEIEKSDEKVRQRKLKAELKKKMAERLARKKEREKLVKKLARQKAMHKAAMHKARKKAKKRKKPKKAKKKRKRRK